MDEVGVGGNNQVQLNKDRDDLALCWLSTQMRVYGVCGGSSLHLSS